VLADDVLQLLLVQLLQLVVLHVQDHAGAAAEPLRLLGGCGAHSELLACAAFPHVGVELVLLGDDGHLVGHEEAGVEPYSELSDQRDIGSALVLGLQELARARVGDDAQTLDEVRLAHADAGVLHEDRVVGLVGHDADAQVGFGLELFRSCDRDLADLVESVGAVGDQLAQEDLLVGIQRVRDEVQQLLDFGLEGMGLLAHG